MSEIVWKAFRLGDLFVFSSGNTFALKDYNLIDNFEDGYVEVVTSSRESDANKYILKSDIPSNCPVYENSLTINRNGSIGYCHFHAKEFIIPTGDAYTLEHRNEELKKSLTIESNVFLSLIISHIFAKTVFGYSYKVNADRFAREIILLPCIEVNSGENCVWEENGKHYSLALDYIKGVMDEAKVIRENKTLRIYESERNAYEIERDKFKDGYSKEKTKLVWKGFRLKDLFERSTKLAMGANQKDLNLAPEIDDSHQVALISASRTGSGRVGYIENGLVEQSAISTNKITFDDQWGYTYFQQERFVITGGHNAILEVTNSNLLKVLEQSLYCYSFISQIINKITIKSGIFGYSYKINNKLDREIVLLPCLEVSDNEECIWQENGKNYTLATDYISYLVLTGKIQCYQELIDNYTYHY